MRQKKTGQHSNSVFGAWNDVIMQITSLNQSEKCEKQIIKLILRWLIYGDFFMLFISRAAFLDFDFLSSHSPSSCFLL